MSIAAIMAPVFAQVALTFAVLIGVGSSRYTAVKAGEVKVNDIALSSDGWSVKIRKISNNYNNQMQLPLMLYIVVAFFILLGKVDLVAVVLAWAFVASRYVHTFIHVGSNALARRFRVFLIGAVIMMSLWVWLALRFYLIG